MPEQDPAHTDTVQGLCQAAFEMTVDAIRAIAKDEGISIPEATHKMVMSLGQSCIDFFQSPASPPRETETGEAAPSNPKLMIRGIDSKSNLCAQCGREYAICGATVEFGDGVGGDNVIACDSYDVPCFAGGE